jgi:dihydrofolate reductase
MIKLIVAKANNHTIGKDNDLIWHLPADMRFFTQTTKGHVVIMGRRNWDSIPLKYRPLSDRINAVVTRNKSFSHSDCDTFNSVEDAINFYKLNHPDKDIFIIGGGQIYEYVIKNNLIDEMFITHIHHDFDGDTWFPEFEESNWKKEQILDFKKDEKNPHDFTIFKYIKK